jgi:hypothetical protein
MSSTSEPRKKPVGSASIRPVRTSRSSCGVPRGDGSFDRLRLASGAQHDHQSLPRWKPGSSEEEARVAGRSKSRSGRWRNRPCVLIGVAGDARRNEIAYTVRPATRARMDWSRFSGTSGDAAIGAVPSEFLENVLAGFVNLGAAPAPAGDVPLRREGCQTNGSSCRCFLLDP